MKKMILTGLMAGIFFIGTVCSVNAGLYTYSFSLDGVTSTAVTPFTSTESATNYYNYSTASGHPAFGAEEKTAFFWLWEETDTGLLSLNVIFNREDPLNPNNNSTTTAGKAYFTLSGLPMGWSWALQDDDEDIDGTYDSTPTWAWNAFNTDGGIISGLQDAEWDITWTADDNPNNFYGVNDFYFISDGSTKKVNSFSLSSIDTLTVSAKTVPVPSAILLFGTGLVGLVGSRIKRKKK